MKYTETKNKKVYNIDFDGTLTTGDSYEVLCPNNEMIYRARELYFAGNIIIIWSARLWADATKIAAWLIQYGVPFHGIMLGKGGSDCYIDDKAIHTDDFIQRE